MSNALDYWRKCAESIKQGIDAIISDSVISQYSKGVASILQQRLWAIELTTSKAQSSFHNISSTDESSSSTNLHDSDFSDSDEDKSDIDADNDYL